MIQKLKNIYHLVQAVVANLLYRFPSREIKVIGVTGTDGKTTTTHLLYHVLSSAGKHGSMLSTIYAKVGGKEYDTGFHVTTPDSFTIQKMIREAVSVGEEYFILETTSHAIDQNRIWGIQYEAAIFTNITHEHLDYHKTIEEYAKTKLRLIEMAKLAVVNIDDEVTNKIVESRKSKVKSLKTYGLSGKADYSVDFRKEILNLADFNAYNYLGVYALCRELKLPDTLIRESFQKFTLPYGRIDIVYDKEFMVLVDFAHTPNAIKHILETIKKIYLKNKGRIIHVFGSAGLRDISKRPLMGEASAQYADVSIITEEDYRTEDPQKISEQIAQGFRKRNKDYLILINREEAIQKALSMARTDDVVVVTGKGHEKSLCRGKKEYPWSDTDCIQAYVHLSS